MLLRNMLGLGLWAAEASGKWPTNQLQSPKPPHELFAAYQLPPCPRPMACIILSRSSYGLKTAQARFHEAQRALTGQASP